ncbi:MAG: hypothetical protein UT66_C0002G0028 [candidate division CPR2 bacterium GW2011_GWC1_39_9]|uniref:DUF1616 domain-containing protein n=1 Tax=candidate division CPR2 bacterium GW2011_GWC2_39_10 TaxID=1618345 RepID=A0A0G0PZ65_UNCC2|nr:MAG: hypothetical protein UT18_C0009G0087 [candidate division CPR2 bacterium GW2011_GWC2_39_10]KKR36150.1 MAG: hypothetical protein UT66_C0002G0028 [candidate division CPR2 bacterium GW2011_GWC1_39_9]
MKLRKISFETKMILFALGLLFAVVILSSIKFFSFLALIYVFFMPGFFIVKTFDLVEEADRIEEIVLSLVLSFGLIPVLMYASNIFGIKVTRTWVIAVSSMIITYCYLRKKIKNEKIFPYNQ